MINYSIKNFKSSQYKDFLQVPSNYGLSKTNQPTLATVKVGEIGEEKNKNKKIAGIIGLSLGSIALLTLIGLFTLSKGFSAGFAKRIRRLSDKIKNTIYDLSHETKKLTTSQKLKLRLSKAIQPITDSMQASSNITAIKDSLFYKLLKKCHLETAVKKLNKFVKNNIVLKTKNEAYQKAELATVELCQFLENAAKQTNNPQLREKANEIISNYTKMFSTRNHSQRAETIWQQMEGLGEKVYNKLFKTKKNFFKTIIHSKSYITTDMIASEKNAIQKNLQIAKTNISNDLNDVYSNIKQALKDIKIEINPQNEKAVNLIKQISENIEKSKKLKGAEELALRKKLMQATRENLQELMQSMLDDGKMQHKMSEMNSKIQNLMDCLSEKMIQKGLAQEAITLLKNNPKEYKIAKKLVNNLNAKLNNAISSEINTYEKLAELQVGSVTTDVLGILAPSALATGLVISSDTKNERISTTLTKGIPILGGIGASYYGMTRGFTGVKNLILGLTTGTLLNIVGAKTDELYKRYAEKQQLLKKTFETFMKIQSNEEQTKA